MDKPDDGNTVVDDSPRPLGERIGLDTALNHVNGLGSTNKAVEDVVVTDDLLKAVKCSVVVGRLLNGPAEVLGYVLAMLRDALKTGVDGFTTRLKRRRQVDTASLHKKAKFCDSPAWFCKGCFHT